MVTLKRHHANNLPAFPARDLVMYQTVHDITYAITKDRGGKYLYIKILQHLHQHKPNNNISIL